MTHGALRVAGGNPEGPWEGRASGGAGPQGQQVHDRLVLQGSPGPLTISLTYNDEGTPPK